MLLLIDDVLLSVLVAKIITPSVVIVVVVTVKIQRYQPLLIAWIDLALNRTFPEPALFVPVTPVFRLNQQLTRLPASIRTKFDAFFLANTEIVIVESAVNVWLVWFVAAPAELISSVSPFVPPSGDAVVLAVIVTFDCPHDVVKSALCNSRFVLDSSTKKPRAASVLGL